MSEWDGLPPEEKARRLGLVEEADPRPDTAKILDELLDEFDLSNERSDARAGWAAAERFARLAFPKNFGEEHDRRREEDWTEQRLLRLVATVMELQHKNPKLSDTKAVEYLLADAKAYRRIWPGPLPPSAGTLRNQLRKALKLLIQGIEAGEIEPMGFIPTFSVEPRIPNRKPKKLHDE